MRKATCLNAEYLYKLKEIIWNDIKYFFFFFHFLFIELSISITFHLLLLLFYLDVYLIGMYINLHYTLLSPMIMWKLIFMPSFLTIAVKFSQQAVSANEWERWRHKGNVLLINQTEEWFMEVKSDQGMDVVVNWWVLTKEKGEGSFNRGYNTLLGMNWLEIPTWLVVLLLRIILMLMCLQFILCHWALCMVCSSLHYVSPHYQITL